MTKKVNKFRVTKQNTLDPNIEKILADLPNPDNYKMSEQMTKFLNKDNDLTIENLLEEVEKPRSTVTVSYKEIVFLLIMRLIEKIK